MPCDSQHSKLNQNLHHLVLGGARSGKSSYAEKQVLATKALAPVYIATAQALDNEMSDRIQRHQRDRDDTWRCIESPLSLAKTIQTLEANTVVLVDCMSLWLNNCLIHECWQSEKQQLMDCLKTTDCHITLVATKWAAALFLWANQAVVLWTN